MQSNYDAILEEFDLAREELYLATTEKDKEFWQSRCNSCLNQLSDHLSTLNIL